MDKISRNEPCPCGSGKKYKKCCGANEAISITHMIENEIDDLQKQILHFAYYYFGSEISDDFSEFEQFLELEEFEERNFYELIHSIWFTLFEELDDGETILEKFIRSEGNKLRRPKLKQILQTWSNARAIAGKVIGIANNKLIVEDGLNGEQLETLMANGPIDIDPGSFFIGILVPYDASFVFFPAPFDLPGLEPAHAFAFIKDSTLEADYDSAQEYLSDFFMEVLSELPMVGGMLEIGEMEWPSPIHQEVAYLFKAKLEELSVNPAVIDTGIILWYQFCEKRQKKIQNQKLYAAALHYLISIIAPLEKNYTQKDLALIYGVSAGSISSIFNEIETVINQELNDIVSNVYDFDEPELYPFSSDNEKGTVIEFPSGRGTAMLEVVKQKTEGKAPKKSTRKASKRDQERARHLIYDAIQSEGKRRYQLAEEALEANPNCVDAYVILAEKTKSLEEAILLYEKGIQAGEKELGSGFFQENKGYFWGLVETRPYMRAKLHYAEALSILGRVDEAIQQFEELLELNPMDNQGARYSLFVAYVDQEEYEKAEILLVEYDEDSAHTEYNKLLLELIRNGFTAKAAMLFKIAKKANRHVLPFLTGKKRLPDYPPDFYGMGDENEAIVYVDLHLHLWRKIDGLEKWLKTNN